MDAIKFKKFIGMFNDSKAPMPYWAEYDDIEARIKAINSVVLNKELEQDLGVNSIEPKKIKI
jgi:hypothetical protein